MEPADVEKECLLELVLPAHRGVRDLVGKS
jgi:hypothetical protein